MDKGFSTFLKCNSLNVIAWVDFELANHYMKIYHICHCTTATSFHPSVRESSREIVFPLNHHHHPHITLSAWIFLTLSRHPSLSSIAFGWSSGLHPVSVQSCCMYVRAGRHAFACPCEGVHRSTSLTNSSLLLQQCSACIIIIIIMSFR